MPVAQLTGLSDGLTEEEAVLAEPMAVVVRELRSHPAGAHAMAMFATERS